MPDLSPKENAAAVTALGAFSQPLVLILRRFYTLARLHRTQSTPLNIRTASDVSVAHPNTFTLFKRQIRAHHPPCKRGSSFILSAHNPERTSLTLSPTTHGAAVPTTTSFTAWPRYAGTASLGQSSRSRQSARTTCAATPTRTTRRCGARLRSSGSANVERSRSPTERSASPMTGSKSHHTTTPHGRNASKPQMVPHFRMQFPANTDRRQHRNRMIPTFKFKARGSIAGISCDFSDAAPVVGHYTRSVGITPDQNGCNAH